VQFSNCKFEQLENFKIESELAFINCKGLDFMKMLEENKEKVVHLEANQLPDQVLKNLSSGSISIECFNTFMATKRNYNDLNYLDSDLHSNFLKLKN